MIVHGLEVSYFTGKLEGYLRLKGLNYRFEPMDTARFIALGRAVGVRQMPHLELADGRVLTDTVAIIDELEEAHGAAAGHPGLTPEAPVTAFLAHLIEAFADEHLWRPALYYRWAFADDARQAARRIAATLLRDVPGPGALKRFYITQRQRELYLRREGSGRRQGRVIEADYLALLDALEPVFSQRDWLLGPAPTRADVGLFGPMFRHFLCDPTPGRILRDRAPATAAWAARLWASARRRPPCARDLQLRSRDVADLAPLLALAADQFLPEAAANARAWAARERRVTWVRDGARFRYRTNPYRVWRLARLGGQYAALSGADRLRVAEVLGAKGAAVLAAGASIPAPRLAPAAVRDRGWRRA